MVKEYAVDCKLATMYSHVLMGAVLVPLPVS
jgi:hypothetical protein